MTECDVLIIGAGASGLAAAAVAGGRGLRTVVLERNEEPAKKLYATGNGRCNISNIKAPDDERLRSFLSEVLGLETVEEEGRVYPRSMEAASVVEALVSGAERASAEIVCGAKAESVSRSENVFSVKTEDGREYVSRCLILACGGKAGIQYGCYGDGYKMAKSLGHCIIKPIPALDAMVCAEDLEPLHGVRAQALAALSKESGVTCGSEFCSIYASRNTEEAAGGSAVASLPAAEQGEVQFTKNGISGIPVMDLSRYLRLEAGSVFTLSLDFFPELSAEELDRLLEDRRRRFGTGLKGLLPEKLAEYIEEPGRERSAKALAFHITGTRGWKTAQVTCGGVPLTEIDPDTMQSKICEGLFITGELLDYDGPCGGYNLNWALRTGLAAGKSVL